MCRKILRAGTDISSLCLRVNHERHAPQDCLGSRARSDGANEFAPPSLCLRVNKKEADFLLPCHVNHDNCLIFIHYPESLFSVQEAHHRIIFSRQSSRG